MTLDVHFYNQNKLEPSLGRKVVNCKPFTDLTFLTDRGS